MMGERETLRSKTSSAPVLDAAISPQAWATSLMARAISVPELPILVLMELPIRSRSRRSSGWNKMTSAIMPNSTALRSR